ncbi:hypothetical protein EAX61_10550 [Dokdonia sinensis]|uniref:Peptidase S74 domain-containing protein n=1 Tax=Dokdonia sinensis TaxID=2479847 RepID=A0A3M0GAK2_9FLAO|nr:hypothetical protein [Dokdonia sinensis]RMB58049.1 hypothetical protein EAX61_10550 [Dokdonia sinensis]
MKQLLQFAFLLIIGVATAQTDGLSYQALIIDPNPQELPGADATGNILPNAPVAVRFTLIDENGSTEYQEVQQTTTDEFGMINLIIGQGQPQSGNLFTEIQWRGKPKDLQVEINLDGSYNELSRQGLAFLPYSLHRDILATGDVQIGGLVDFRRNLVVDGTTDLNGNVSVNNNSATILTGTLQVDMRTELNDKLTVLNSSNTELTGKLNVDGDTRFASILNVEGAVTMRDELSVDKATQLNSTLEVFSNTTLRSDLTVTDQSPTLLTGTLTVDGVTNLNDTVNINNGSPLNVSGDLNVDGITTFDNDLIVNGTTNLNNSLNVNNGATTTLSGILLVKEDTSLQSSLLVQGQTNLEDALNVNNQSPTLLSGSLTVDGDTNLNSSLSVNNASPTLLSGDLDVDGNVNLNNNLTVNGVTNLNDGLFVNNASPTNLSGALTVAGATDLNNTLIVDGETTLNSNMTVANASATNLTGALNVDLATTLNNTLDVTNGAATTLSGTLDVDQATTLNNTLEVTNASATSLSGTLTVDGQSTLNNNVLVANASPTLMTGTLGVDGQTTLNNGLTVANASPVNLTGTLDVAGVTNLNDAVDISGLTTIDDDLVVTGSATLGSLTTENINITSDNAGFIATFENLNNSSGDGIVIKLGKTHGAWDGSDYLSLPNPVASDLGSALNVVKGKFANPGPLTPSEIIALAPNALKLGAISNINNLVFDAFNSNLPSVPIPSIDFPDIPLLTGRTIFPGVTIPFVNVTIPAWQFPTLKIDSFNLLNPIPDLIPNLPINLPTTGLRDVQFPNIPTGDTANGDSLDKGNVFIAFQDKEDRQLGAIRAQSLKDFKDATICNPIYLQEVIASFVGVDLLDGIVSGVVQMSSLIDEYNSFGVEYASGNGDYAEWLERANHEEYLSAGDIVAVKGGKITKDIKGLEQIMVVSHRPIVLGNVPDESRTHLGNNVAFMGQVPVKIMGPVRSGDYVVAGANIKGYGKAISPKDMTPEDFVKAVGRSWEQNENDGPKLVNTVVGVHNGDWVKVLQKLEKKQRAFQEKYNSLEAQVERLDKIASDISNGIND